MHLKIWALLKRLGEGLDHVDWRCKKTSSSIAGIERCLNNLFRAVEGPLDDPDFQQLARQHRCVPDPRTAAC